MGMLDTSACNASVQRSAVWQGRPAFRDSTTRTINLDALFNTLTQNPHLAIMPALTRGVAHQRAARGPVRCGSSRVAWRWCSGDCLAPCMLSPPADSCHWPGGYFGGQ